MWEYYEFLFDSNLSVDNLRLDYMRTIITTGFPLEINGVRYKNYIDDPDDKQEEYISEYVF